MVEKGNETNKQTNKQKPRNKTKKQNYRWFIDKC